ncbi:MAG: NADP-dependent phosphogluconate dehydrogenase [Myxococcales bacterium]|nr:NADP-dependent phosphogluconate dehydrogenase [Myxococcales bacterium]
MSTPSFGIIGMAVMGRNLALNMLDHGVDVVVHNRDPELTTAAVAASGGRLKGAASLQELVRELPRPRRILMMIKAGAPVDSVLEQLEPLLSPGDVVIDGGNSWYVDTQRRQRAYAEAGLHFVGSGVSGGEEGARHGPSLMPGGEPAAYAAIAPVFEAISAKTESGPCVTHCGPDGAGHFVKMVHNGIEYADMQLIAEAYHVLARVGGLGPERLAEVFAGWNQGVLQSFLVEITARIFTVRDPDSEGFLVDRVLDRAGQKGTGRWTAQVALTHGVPVPTIAAAVDARVLSSRKAQRVAMSSVLEGPTSPATAPDDLVQHVHDALYAAKITAYAQGFDLIAQVSHAEGWSVPLGELARIWKGGCIIRARFLDDIMAAYGSDPALSHLLRDTELRRRVTERQATWRGLVGLAVAQGVPVPAMSAGLAYYDSLRTADLPQNLTQAQRDAFGAHTYQRNDAAEELDERPFLHTEWLG